MVIDKIDTAILYLRAIPQAFRPLEAFLAVQARRTLRSADGRSTCNESSQTALSPLRSLIDGGMNGRAGQKNTNIPPPNNNNNILVV